MFDAFSVGMFIERRSRRFSPDWNLTVNGLEKIRKAFGSLEKDVNFSENTFGKMEKAFCKVEYVFGGLEQVLGKVEKPFGGME